MLGLGLLHFYEIVGLEVDEEGVKYCEYIVLSDIHALFEFCTQFLHQLDSFVGLARAVIECLISQLHFFLVQVVSTLKVYRKAPVFFTIFVGSGLQLNL